MSHKIISTLTLLIPLRFSMSGCHSTNSHASIRGVFRETTSPAATGSFSPRVTPMTDGSALLTWLDLKTTGRPHYAIPFGGEGIGLPRERSRQLSPLAATLPNRQE
jgi:hypothetical protein